MSAYREPKDIINAALIQLGLERIRSTSEQSVNATEGNAAYNRLREVELRRNNWSFAIRRVVLRAIGTTAYVFIPPAYAAGTTYGQGEIATYDSEWWQSQAGSNLGNTPAPGDYWQHYYGVDSFGDYDADISYFAGEIVGASDSSIYLSIINGNDTDPASDPSNWVLIGTAAASNFTELVIIYPIGAGPSTQNSTRNVYRLPKGFLRRAPRDPKAGINPWLGGPSRSWADDWTIEGGYIITGELSPIMLRYVADVTNVAMMDPMFCEALGGLIAVRIGPRVIEAGKSRADLIANAKGEYKAQIFEARTINGIEAGPVELPEDDYITARY